MSLLSALTIKNLIAPVVKPTFQTFLNSKIYKVSPRT